MFYSICSKAYSATSHPVPKNEKNYNYNNMNNFNAKSQIL